MSSPADTPPFSLIRKKTDQNYNIWKSQKQLQEEPTKTKGDVSVDWITKDDEYEKIPKLASSGFRVEPGEISAILESKQRTKESLKKRTVNVTAAEAFDYLFNTFMGKERPNKYFTEVDPLSSKRIVKKHSLKSNIKSGIKGIGEIVDEIGKLPNVQKIGKQQEAELRYLKSANRRIRRDIAVTAIGNKKEMTAGSLFNKKSFRTDTNVVPATNRTCQKVFPKVVNRKGGDIMRYFTENGREITAAQARKILDENPKGYATVYNAFNAKTPVLNQKSTPLVLFQRNCNQLGVVQKYDPIGKVTRVASPSGLVRRDKNSAESIVCR